MYIDIILCSRKDKGQLCSLMTSTRSFLVQNECEKLKVHSADRVPAAVHQRQPGMGMHFTVSWAMNGEIVVDVESR